MWKRFTLLSHNSLEEREKEREREREERRKEKTVDII